jgi:hypothetical protein
MNLLTPSGPLDAASTPSGDMQFLGVDERSAPQAVSAGMVCAARNRRFRYGRADTRGGITLLPWMKGTGMTPWTDVYGGAVFADPNASGEGGEWILIAADGGVWRTAANRTAVVVPLPAGETLTRDTFCKFIQANAGIILLRGLNATPLVCTDLEVGFTEIPTVNTWSCTFDHRTNWVGLEANNLLVGDPVQFTGGKIPVAITASKTYYVLDTPNADAFTISETAGGAQVTWNEGQQDMKIDSGTVEVIDGASPIPDALDGIFKGNRLYLISGKDTIAVSDIGDYTRYQVMAESFRINEGDSHTLRALCMYNESTLLCFKSGAVWKVLGATGDLSGAQGPLNVTPSYGLAGPQSLALYGNDVYWLTSELRVSSIQLNELNKEKGTNTALSDPLTQTFGRIAPGLASAARVAVWNGYLFVALPLDLGLTLDPANVIANPVMVAQGHWFPPAYLDQGVITVVPGANYYWTQGANGGALINGTETLRGDGEFTAQTNHIELEPFTGDVTLEITDVIQRVLSTGNNAVAVYDFQQGAWCGTDEPVGVVDFLKFTYGGSERLGFIGADGWLHLYDDGYEDEQARIIAPYVDVQVVGDITMGMTMQVNNSPVIEAVGTAPLNPINVPPMGWGVADQASGAQNLWQDLNGTGGWNTAAANSWSSSIPDMVVTKIDFGVRFETIGFPAVPVVKINGTAMTGFSNGLYIDSHDGTQIVSTPIPSYLKTRGYLCTRPWSIEALAGSGAAGKMKRFLYAAMHMATWSPNYTINILTQGNQASENYVPGETRNPLNYFDQFEALAWDPSNVNDDYDTRGREDYAYTENGLGLNLGSGCTFDAMQEYSHRVPMSERGIWMQIELINSQGIANVAAIALEAVEGETSGGVTVN